MLGNMQKATELKRGDANIEDIVKATRSEMNDFVAFYRCQPLRHVAILAPVLDCRQTRAIGEVLCYLLVRARLHP